MSSDGKNFSFAFRSDPKVAKFEHNEGELYDVNTKACIFNYKLKSNADDRALVTGCENEVREMLLLLKNSAPISGKFHPNGDFEEIEHF